MRRKIVGVMGAGEKATPEEKALADQLGQAIAQNNWILLTGGRNVGVMDAASQGAKAAGGLVIGILPSNNKQGVSEAVDIAIATDLGNGRNNINVLSSELIVACGMGCGTASEVALALKNRRPVILLHQKKLTEQFFQSLAPNLVYTAEDLEQAIALIREILSS